LASSRLVSALLSSDVEAMDLIPQSK